jgi:hypothetical protein
MQARKVAEDRFGHASVNPAFTAVSYSSISPRTQAALQHVCS